PGQVRVRIQAGGICGSDLHYYLHGGFGTIRIREPMVLGHEVAGVVESVAPDVTTVAPGQVVAVNPSLPCHHCRYCRMGLQNQCLNMRFYGSAMVFPHVQGGFREFLVVDADRAVPIPAEVSVYEAAFAEPLAVALHAVARAGSLLGRRVLVAGAGPIGSLTVAAARHAGAAEIVVTDLHDAALEGALEVGADRAINVGRSPEALAPFEAEKGAFDVMFEAAGSEATLLSGLKVVRACGTIVQIGQGAQASLPMSMLVTKEIDLIGTFRFHGEFALAVDTIAHRRIDVRPLLTEVVPLAEAVRAFELAADRTRAMKVQLGFD
ncbi:MAG TPA: L-idonate 5-dehydrogenase, partial [Dongiaceae bacterium]|nr:L-idonate 5-dehydrogenase [Dongiaceae bacterium]